MKRFPFFLLMVMIILVFGSLTVLAEKVYVMKFGWIDPPDPYSNPTSAYAVTLKSEVERLSGGRIKVELYPAGQLGDQRSSVEQVRKGTIEACNISSGVLASAYYPPLELVDMPFLFTSYEHVRLVVNSDFMKNLIEDCAKKTGIRILSLQPFGFRHIFNSRRPIKVPSDLKGLKIRTMEIVPHMKLIEAAGGTPTPMPMLELYTALQTKVVDGAENTISNILAQKYYQVQKYLTLTGHLMGIGATIINEEWFQSLPSDLKAALVEGEKTAWLVYSGIGQLVSDVKLDELKKKMEVYVPTTKEIELWKEKTQPYVKEYLVEKLGKDLVDEFLKIVDEARQQIVTEATSLGK
ncbi:TRAP transporter substrate-binding protein [Pseudothermotoga sp.]|jgi:C4-dicarboxylate-binding protein DctP|uniref:TRAP transporter substrate-binding protein n=1 Tax=Pseudothermotoga sp. TaxID=2033661 RepID=UPI00258C46B8|nr:TRAP transporter substrate-binding protein [Pseudothermotoga sp.]MDK2885149.1 TRAP-type transport system periplasmic protein [Pseudothermotoga sp.]